jgi:transposase-like protein
LKPAAKAKLHDIWQVDTREHATQAFDLFLETYQAKYPKPTECLENDRDVLLAMVFKLIQAAEKNLR